MRSIILLILMVSSLSSAGEQSGKIQLLYARASDNLQLVILTGGTPRSDAPSCATKGYWLIRDENSVTGKAQFSQLLAAQLAGKTVRIQGLNTCERWRDGEDINYISIEN